MASSPLKSNSRHHVRSISLPSRPLLFTSQVDENFSRLKSSEATSSSLSSIGNMYNSFNDLLLLPKTQQEISKYRKQVEEVLDDYFRLFDFCAMAKDISLQTKEDVQSLSSMLRRNRVGNELQTFLTLRKRTKKTIQKSLKELKDIKSKRKNMNGSEQISSLFKEVEEGSLDFFELLMSNIAGTMSRSILSSMFTKTKTLSSKEERNENVFDDVEEALHVLINTKATNFENTKIESLQRQLEKIKSNIQYFEEGLECLFRRLIKTRVELLNILNH